MANTTFSYSLTSLLRLLDYWEFSGGTVNLTAIRTVRVLRPLRAINRIPSRGEIAGEWFNIFIIFRYEDPCHVTS